MFSYWSEWRHSPCLMTPLTTLLSLIIMVLGLLYLIFSLPQLLIGAILGIFLKRGNLLVEFLYPTNLGKWGHLFLLRLGMKRSKTGTHSRCSDFRVELCDGVYVHCIPQLTDNMAYGILFEDEFDVKAMIVDVADPKDLKRQLDLMSVIHYEKKKITIQAVLSTHKHHDHTAGNGSMKSMPIYGGAIEKVPYCTHYLKNGDYVKLPVTSNGCNNDVQIEAIATPSHTRGSLVYVLRTKENTFLFTGDAMFSAGGGVPFEAETNTCGEDARKKKWNSYMEPAAGMNSMERVFCEILLRSTANDTNQALIFPGHEYTFDLLQRQFDVKTPFAQDFTTNVNVNKVSSYSTFPPKAFFNTVSQYYIAAHRRTLPRSGGRMLTIPSTIKRELDINPHFRNLVKRGNVFITALRLYRKYLSANSSLNKRHTIDKSFDSTSSDASIPLSSTSSRSVLSSDSAWTITSHDVHKELFTTVYTDDLQNIILALRDKKINHLQAADALLQATDALASPVVEKRPIPNTLLSDKSIWAGSLSLAILGAGPTAMTPSDAERMNLPPPVHRQKADEILISRTRLIRALYQLGAISSTSVSCSDVLSINHLWNDAIELQQIKMKSSHKKTYDSINEEHMQCTELPDLVPLLHVKSALYGLNMQSRKYCVPCTSSSSLSTNKQLRRSSGELVRHHPAYCRLCRYFVVEEDDNIQEEKEKEVLDGPCLQHDDEGLEMILSDGEETSSKHSKVSLLSHSSAESK